MDSDPDEETSYRFLCLVSAEGKVAAAYYEMQTSRVCVMSQMPEPGTEFDVAKRVLRQVEPVVTIIPSNSAADFVTEIRSVTDQDDVKSRTPAVISESIAQLRPDMTDDMDLDTDQPAGSSSRTSESQSVYQTPGSTSATSESDQNPRKRQKRSVTQPLLNRVSENVVTLAGKFFAIENAKNFLLQYDGFGLEANASRAERLAFLSGVIDFEETVTVRALAGLLTYLSRSAINQLVAITGQLIFTKFRLPAAVLVNEAAIRSLGVLCEVLVPRPDRVTPSRRQELSLVRLFQAHCRTGPGKKQVRQMLMQPIREKRELDDRLNFAEHFLKQENAGSLDPGSGLMIRIFRVKPLNSVLRQMRCKLSPLSDWKKFVHGFKAAVICMQYMKDLKKPDAMSVRAAELLTPEIMDLMKLIDESVSLSPVTNDKYAPENSGFFIPVGYNAELDEKREMSSQMDQLLTAATKREADEWTSRNLPVPQFAITFTYGPGFLLELSLATESLYNVMDMLSQRGSDQIFDARTQSGTHVYYKTTDLKKFDLHYGDAIQDIAALVVHIQLYIQEQVLQQADTITEMTDHCASVEALLAFAEMARRTGWSRPIFTENELVIAGGRHPLYEELLKKEEKDEFQQNGTTSPSNGRKVHIITGPNASGKTVYLKQTGIICYLALCGSYVPAESAKIPILDSIFTILKHNYSITMESSTFFSDLKGMSSLMNQATAKSLCLIDEFGKGTRPQDGIALLAHCVQYSLKRETPFLLIASHMHCLSHVLNQHFRSIQYLRFSPEVSSDGLFVPTFMIEEGKTESSLASSVYATIKMDPFVAQMANLTFEQLRERKDLEPHYDEYQKRIIAYVDAVMDVFMQTNCNSAQAIVNMFHEVRKLTRDHGMGEIF